MSECVCVCTREIANTPVCNGDINSPSQCLQLRKPDSSFYEVALEFGTPVCVCVCVYIFNMHNYD